MKYFIKVPKDAIKGLLTMWKHALACVFLFLLLLVGCSPFHYCPPARVAPEEWKTVEVEPCPKRRICLERWWEIFDDSALNELETAALRCNESYILAFQKICEARGIARGVCSRLTPQASLQPSYANQGSLIKIPFPFLTNDQSFRFHNLLDTVPVMFSFEVDLFGRLSKACEAKQALVQASEEDMRTVFLTLTTDVATHYFTLRALDAQVDVLCEAVANLTANLELTQNKYREGMATGLDQSLALQQLTQTEADLHDVKRLRILEENALAVLTGSFAPDFCIAKGSLCEIIPDVSVGMPSELLCRRPDIASAERNLAALHAEIGVAFAQLFPSLTFTGILGFQSPFTDKMFSWESRLWAMGAQAVQALYDGGKRFGDIDVAKARYYQALSTYQQTVYQAFADVENALGTILEVSLQLENLNTSVEAAAFSRDLSKTQNREGLVSYFDYLAYQRQWLDVSRLRIQVLGSRHLATVALIKALAGGWTELPPSEEGYEQLICDD